METIWGFAWSPQAGERDDSDVALWVGHAKGVKHLVDVRAGGLDAACRIPRGGRCTAVCAARPWQERRRAVAWRGRRLCVGWRGARVRAIPPRGPHFRRVSLLRGALRLERRMYGGRSCAAATSRPSSTSRSLAARAVCSAVWSTRPALPALSRPAARPSPCLAARHQMWDFAWFNIDSCAKSPSAPLLRYVPLAALPDSPKIARQPESGAAHLSFFGGPWQREACLQSIR